MVNVPAIVSPLYCATPWDRNVPYCVVQVVAQVTAAPFRFMSLTWQENRGLTGTVRAGSMQLVKLLLISACELEGNVGMSP